MNEPVKRFTLKVALILLPFILLFTWIEYTARLLPNSYAMKKEHFTGLHDSVEVLVLGSSHALKGMNTAEYSCTGFNLSNSSQTLIHDSWLCTHYLDYLPRLKAVIFDISYISYFFDLKDSPEEWRNYFYYHYFDMNDPSLDLFSPPAFFYTALYTRGLINDVVFHRLDAKKEFGDIKPDGWENTAPPADSSVISDFSGLQRVRLHESLVKEGNYSRIMEGLTGALKELNRRNIRIIFITLPVYKTYSEHLNPSREKKNNEITSSLCREFNILYRDYSKDPRFGKEDFSDNDHLNYLGAVKFSRIIDRELLAGFCR